VVPPRTGDSTGPAHTMSLPRSSVTPEPAQAPVDAAPAVSGQPADQVSTPRPSTEPRQQVRGTRAGRLWVGACAAALITVALIVFMLQNTHTVVVSFLGLTGSTSLALMLLIAAVGGMVVTLLLGSARIIQLRRAVRRRHS
jgi:uncharacterized integral membrane protein